MAEHTYKSKGLIAVINWDINQITDAVEGTILADVSIHAYTPSMLDINESYSFRHSGVHYNFIIKCNERYSIATKCLLGLSPTITVELEYLI